jgi:hypothetical protein
VSDWPILPDEADEIPDELALRVGKAVLCDRWLTIRYVRALSSGGRHCQAYLDLSSAADEAETAAQTTLTMALEALDDGT